MGVRAADVAVERDLELVGRRLGDGEADAEDRVGAQAALVVGAVEVAERGVDQPLLEGLLAEEHLGDLAVDVADRLLHALAAVALSAVAQLDRLVFAGRRPARHGGTAPSPADEHDLGLDRGIAPRVEDLASLDVHDLAHVSGR